jgi:hypothetical protein
LRLNGGKEKAGGHERGSEVFIHGSPLHGPEIEKTKPAGAAGFGVGF